MRPFGDKCLCSVAREHAEREREGKVEHVVGETEGLRGRKRRRGLSFHCYMPSWAPRTVFPRPRSSVRTGARSHRSAVAPIRLAWLPRRAWFCSWVWISTHLSSNSCSFFKSSHPKYNSDRGQVQHVLFIPCTFIYVELYTHICVCVQHIMCIQCVCGWLQAYSPGCEHHRNLYACGYTLPNMRG